VKEAHGMVPVSHDRQAIGNFAVAAAEHRRCIASVPNSPRHCRR
jgi:hypothetical protein